LPAFILWLPRRSAHGRELFDPIAKNPGTRAHGALLRSGFSLVRDLAASSMV
jgi:hypothetical protein